MNLLKIFRKDKAEKEKTPRFGELMKPGWDAAFKAYHIGKQFEYLGRKMVVVDHVQYRPSIDGCGYYYFPAQYPEIVVEYADERGEIRTHKFKVGTINQILPNAGASAPATDDVAQLKTLR